MNSRPPPMFSARRYYCCYFFSDTIADVATLRRPPCHFFHITFAELLLMPARRHTLADATPTHELAFR
jgi:hypothetical protein